MEHDRNPTETSLPDDEPLAELWTSIEERMGVCPSFFKLAQAEPEIARGLFELAKFAYLDSPMPAEFKEKLFTFLSRFCPARYCVTRHAAFLLGRGYIAGDPDSPALSAKEVVEIVTAPLPDSDEVMVHLKEFQLHPYLNDWPDYHSHTGTLLRTACSRIFLEPQRSIEWTTALRKVAGPKRYEQLMLFLAFVRTAHFWTEVHPELTLEQDVETLLGEHESLLRPLLKDTGDAARTLLGKQLQDELVELRQAPKMVDELREREQVLRQAADVAGMGIIEVDYVADVSRLDQAAAELFALPSEKPIPRRDVHARFHADDREELGRRIRASLSATGDGGFSMEHRIVHPNGAVKWLSVRKRIKFDDAGAGRVPISAVLIAIDVTDQKEYEAALRESEERFRGTFENAAVGIAHVGLDGKWLRVNDRLCTIVGYSRDEMLELSFQDITHADDLAADLAQVHKLLASEIDHYTMEKRYVDKSGAMVWVNLTVSLVRDARGKPHYFIAVVEAIAERKQAEERERRLMADAVALNAKFQATFRQSAIFAGIMTPDGIVIEANQVCLEVCGYQADEVLGRLFWECGWWRGLDSVQAKLRTACLRAAEGESYREELPYLWADDSEHTVDFALHPIRDETNQVIFLYPTGMDITERKQFEHSLRQARDVAEAANRSRGEFLANMSHEIRTPMTAILGHTELLGEHLNDPDNLHCVETIRRNGKFLLEIINDILDLSKIDAGRLEVERDRVSPQELIGEIQSLMNVRAAEKKVPLEFEFDGKVPALIETDAVRLRQILLNLIGNAIKFTGDGTVTVATSYRQDTREMRFAVTDTGIGIREEDIPRLFQPFTQADASTTREYGGTGLGLTISNRLAQALDGDISVESKLGQGSTFTLTIGCGEIAHINLVIPTLKESVPALASMDDVRLAGRILVVDDRRDIRHLAQHFIEQAGGDVIIATNGREAIEAVNSTEANGHKVDLVLMDMQMPVMDGYSAAEQLRKNGYKQPIIALTANAMKEDRQKCLDAGCDDYASKPLDGPSLVRIIGDYLSRS